MGEQDWADERAREWLEQRGDAPTMSLLMSGAYGVVEVSDENAGSLAALLREVWHDKRTECIREEREIRDAHWRKLYADQQHRLEQCEHLTRQAMLAEVRRVVEDVRDAQRPPGIPRSGRDTCDEILRRLEKL